MVYVSIEVILVENSLIGLLVFIISLAELQAFYWILRPMRYKNYFEGKAHVTININKWTKRDNMP